MRRRWLFGITTTAAAALMVFFVASAAGVLSGSPSSFEANDGNMIAGSGNHDWNNVTYTHVADVSKDGTDDSFTPGQKQDTTCPTIDLHGNPPKDDFTDIAFKSEVNSTSGDTYLYGATIRYAANGNASENIELNQGTGGLCPGSTTLLARVVNDKLLAIDYVSGGPQFHVLTWVASGACNVANDPAPCWGAAVTTLTAAGAEGAVNTAAITAANNIIGSGAGAGALVAGQFAEFGVNLRTAGIITGSGQCETFSQTVFESRSSGSSFVSSTKDVSVSHQPITNCATVNVTKAGSDGGSQAGVIFTLTGPSPSGATQTCTVDSNGQCGTSPSFKDLQPGTYTLSESNLPAGYTADTDLPETFTIAAGDTVTKAYTNNAQPGSIAITKTDDASNPLEGVTFTATGPSPGSGTASCTTNASGTCTISGLSPGSYSVDESGLPAGYGTDSDFPVTVTVTNGNTANVGAQDPRLFKAIVLVCRQFDSTLYSSAITVDTAASGNSETSAQLGTLLQTWATAQGKTLTAADKTAFETAVCGITNGAKAGLRSATDASNPHAASIDIPH